MAAIWKQSEGLYAKGELAHCSCPFDRSAFDTVPAGCYGLRKVERKEKLFLGNFRYCRGRCVVNGNEIKTRRVPARPAVRASAGAQEDSADCRLCARHRSTFHCRCADRSHCIGSVSVAANLKTGAVKQGERERPKMDRVMPAIQLRQRVWA